MADEKQISWWAGLNLQWDDDLSVRKRIRDGQRLLLPHPNLKVPDGVVERSVHNLRYNKCVILPALERWAANGPDVCPGVDYLYAEVEKFYKLCNRTDVSVADMYADS